MVERNLSQNILVLFPATNLTYALIIVQGYTIGSGNVGTTHSAVSAQVRFESSTTVRVTASLTMLSGDSGGTVNVHFTVIEFNSSL